MLSTVLLPVILALWLIAGMIGCLHLLQPIVRYTCCGRSRPLKKEAMMCEEYVNTRLSLLFLDCFARVLPVLGYCIISTFSDGAYVPAILCLVVHFLLALFDLSFVCLFALRMSTGTESKEELFFFVKEFNYVTVNEIEEEEKVNAQGNRREPAMKRTRDAPYAETDRRTQNQVNKGQK